MFSDNRDPRCPVCGKPCFYAPNAREDSAKWACSDIECVNAHGLVYWPITDEEFNEVLAAALEVDSVIEEAGSIRRAPRCSYCGMLISEDPTDPESWVHILSADAQCIVDGVKLDAWAQPSKEDRP